MTQAKERKMIRCRSKCGIVVSYLESSKISVHTVIIEPVLILHHLLLQLFNLFADMELNIKNVAEIFESE